MTAMVKEAETVCHQFLGGVNKSDSKFLRKLFLNC